MKLQDELTKILDETPVAKAERLMMKEIEAVDKHLERLMIELENASTEEEQKNASASLDKGASFRGGLVMGLAYIRGLK